MFQIGGEYGPRAWDIYVKMADLLQTAGDGKQAMEAYEQAAWLAPNEVTPKPSPHQGA